MTEKRFTLTNPKNAFQEMKCGIDDRGNTLTFNDVVECLNHLYEEKGVLINTIKELMTMVNSMPCRDNVAMTPQVAKIIKEYENG